MKKSKIALLSALQYGVLLKIKDGQGVLKTDTDRYITKDGGLHINKRTISKLMDTSFLSYVSETECQVSYYGERYLVTHKIVTSSVGHKRVTPVDAEQLHVDIIDEKKMDLDKINGMVEFIINDMVDVVEERIMKRIGLIKKEYHAAIAGQGDKPEIEKLDDSNIEEIKEEEPKGGERIRMSITKEEKKDD